ncbi:hypothetical protein GCM10027436_37250 [Actinophytocola sediminis]
MAGLAGEQGGGEVGQCARVEHAEGVRIPVGRDMAVDEPQRPASARSADMQAATVDDVFGGERHVSATARHDILVQRQKPVRLLAIIGETALCQPIGWHEMMARSPSEHSAGGRRVAAYSLGSRSLDPRPTSRSPRF